MSREFRRWLSWQWPRAWRLPLCFLGWHYWRHNTLWMGDMAGGWLRWCNDCGQWQRATYDMAMGHTVWRNFNPSAEAKGDANG